MASKKQTKKDRRAVGQTTLTISLPQELKELIESAAGDETRSISNYLVKELSLLLASKNPKGTSEGGEKK